MGEANFDVIGVGANSVDEVYRLPAYPTPDGPGAKLRILDHTTSPGGQTATTLATCAAAGLRAAYVGALGPDAAGTLMRGTLDTRGVDTSLAVTRRVPNASAVILLDDQQGERIVLWSRDDGLALDPAELPERQLQRARLVHVDDVDERVAVASAACAAAAGVPVTTDIERVGRATEDLLWHATVPILAEHVPDALTGEPDLELALRQLRERHGGTFVVTRGARGAALLDGDRLLEAAAPAVDVVDTTGAGNVFRGALIAALLGGRPPAEMLAIAVAAASLSCTRAGAVPGVPTPEEMRALLGR